MTLVDIVMPYYGDVPLMQEAVHSVLAQTHPDWRLTVVDDGVADGVPEWFASLGDPRVHYQRNEHNLGILGNFQKCLDLAERDYVVMIGSDDVMLPHYLEVVTGLIGRFPEAEIIQPGVQVIDGAGAPTRSLVDEAKRRLYAPRPNGPELLGGEDLEVSLLRGNWLYFPALCWRRESIASVGFDARWAVIQDLAVVLHLVERGARLALDLDQVCFQYRRHEASKSSVDAAAGRRFSEAARFFAEVAERVEARGWHRAAKAARRHFSSRLHALTMLPGAAARRNAAGVRELAGHAFGSTRGR